MTTKERLKEFVSKQGLGQNAFEKKVGIAIGYLASKSVSVTSDTIEKVIENFPNLNLDWLITGEGDMIKNSGVNIGGNNKVGDVANSSSHINKNTINVTLPESGDQKIIDPDGRVEISKIDSSNKELESLTREYELLKIRYSHLEDSMKMKDDIIASQRDVIELLKHKQ